MIKRLTFRNPYEKNRLLYRQNTLPCVISRLRPDNDRGCPLRDARWRPMMPACAEARMPIMQPGRCGGVGGGGHGGEALQVAGMPCAAGAATPG